jgi:hypothetical protein
MNKSYNPVAVLGAYSVSSLKMPDEAVLGRPNASTLRMIDKMSSEELFQSLVATGIYTKAGKLMREYGGSARAKR